MAKLDFATASFVFCHGEGYKLGLFLMRLRIRLLVQIIMNFLMLQ